MTIDSLPDTPPAFPGAPSWFEGVPEEIAAPRQELSEAAVRQVAAGDHPKIAPPPDLVVDLPRGYTEGLEGGRVHRRAVVRELTGRDEEALARYKGTEEIFNAIICLGTERLGELDFTGEPISARTRILGSLLLGERLMIYLKVTEATFGNEREFKFTCSACKKEQQTTILLDTDFPIEIPEGLRMEHTFTCRNGKVITYRLLIGNDVLEMEQGENRSLAEVNTEMLSRIITSIDGEMPLDALEAVRDLTIGDRDRLLEDIEQHQPTPLLPPLKIECIGCHEEVTAPVAWGELFRP